MKTDSPAFQVAMDCALLHAQPLGEVVLHKLVVHHRKAHLIRKACRDILTKLTPSLASLRSQPWLPPIGS